MLTSENSYSIEKIADLPFYTEGPATDSLGNIYCSTLTGGTIVKVDSRSRLTEWARLRCPNGQIILPDDQHLICDSQPAAIRRFDHRGRFVKNEMERFCGGIPVYVPNDLIMDNRHNLYFTDSIRHKGKVCFIGAGGEQRIIAADLDYPNGLACTPDQKWLYVAESYRNRIIKIALDADGSPTQDTAIYAELPKHASGNRQDNLPDGLHLDREGNLWVAHYGMQAIHKFSPEGRLLRSIDSTLPLTSNLIFADARTLIVTGGYGEPGPGALLRITIG